MEFGSPEKQDGTTRVSIQIETPLQVQYESNELENHTTPPPNLISFKNYLGQIAQYFEIYSKKWFSNPVFPTIFLDRLTHTWDTGTFSPYRGKFKNSSDTIQLYQEWCPEQLSITLRGYTISWKLVHVQYDVSRTNNNSTSGTNTILEMSTDYIPVNSTNAPLALQTTLRSKALRKVRQARLLAAVSKARADRLVQNYYEKYGNLEDLDSNSVLSSDSDE